MSLISAKRCRTWPAAGWMVAILPLGGCFLRADIPTQPSVLPPPAAAKETDKAPPAKSPGEAETLRELARHVDAAEDHRFTDAAQSPLAAVRIEALHAWAASKRGPVPQIVVDLHYDDDPRVRAAALAMLAARKHPDAVDYLALARCTTLSFPSAWRRSRTGRA